MIESFPAFVSNEFSWGDSLRNRTEAPSIPNHSERLVRRLFEPYKTPESELAALEGVRVEIKNSSNGEYQDVHQGEVKSVVGRILFVDVDAIHRYFGEGDDEFLPVTDGWSKVVHAYFITDDPLELGVVDPDDPRVKYEVLTHLPPRMSIFEGPLDLVGFDLKDPDLDKFLDRGLKFFPRIRTPEDLALLTDYVNSSIAYKNKVWDSEKWYTPGVGKAVAGNGAVCTDLAAIEIAMLELRGISCKFVLSKTHAYLAIDNGLEGQTERILADPTWNITGYYNDFLAKHKSSGLGSRHHFPAKDYRFEPNWDRRM